VNIPILSGFARWDSGYFMQIAVKGYTSVADYAFRPLYPLILRIAYQPFNGWLGTDRAELVGGLIWNVVALALAGIYLSRLTKSLLGPQVATRTIAILAVYPATFFLSAIYAEATTLLLVVLAFYFLERGSILTAGSFGFLAALTRPEGFLLFVPFLVKARESVRRVRMILASLAILAGLFVFLLFSYYSSGSFFTSLTAENLWNKLTLKSFILHPSGLLSPQNSADILPIVINFLVMGLATSFLILSVVRKNGLKKAYPYFVWSIVLLVAFFTFGDIRSFARLTLVMPTVFWSLAYYTVGHDGFYSALISFFAVLMSISTLLFAGWYPML
jgi:hypothetical protein